MKQLIATICLIGTVASAALPIQSNTVTSDVSKIEGDFNGFNWKWLGYNTQSNNFYIKNGSSWVDLTGLNVGYKMSRNTRTGLVAYVSSTNVTITASNIYFSVANTNIPENGSYLFEVYGWSGASTNQSRTLAQGKIKVNQSLYQDDDGTFPWPASQTNLTAYLLKTEAIATYQDIITTSFSEGTSNNVDLTSDVLSVVFKTNYLFSTDSTYTNTVALAGSALQSDTNYAKLNSNQTLTGANTFNQTITATNGALFNSQTLFATPGFTTGVYINENGTFLNILGFKIMDAGTSTLSSNGGIWKVEGTATNGTEIMNYDAVVGLGYITAPPPNDTTTTNMTQAVTVPTQTAGSSNSVIANTAWVKNEAASEGWGVETDTLADVLGRGNNANGLAITNVAGVTASGTVSAEQLTSTDDISAAGTISTMEQYLFDGVNAVRLYKGTDAYYGSVAVGQDSGSTNIRLQTAVGHLAGGGNNQPQTTLIGWRAGYLGTKTLQTAVGSQAGESNSGIIQTAVGSQAGRQNTGVNQTAMGYQAGYQNSGASQTAIGYQAGYQNSGAIQTAMGYLAGYQNTGVNQTAMGYQAGRQNSGASQTAMGYLAGYYIADGVTVNTNSANATYLGANTRSLTANDSNIIVIGQGAIGKGSNTAVWGNTNIQTNYFSGDVKVDGATAKFMFDAGDYLTGNGTNLFYVTADGTITNQITSN